MERKKANLIYENSENKWMILHKHREQRNITQ